MAGLTALLATAAAALGLPGSSTAAAPVVSVYPTANSRVVPPGAQISFRGISPSAIGSFTVTGSRSGHHTGVLRAHSDGRGASFIPDKPFVPTEHVTIATRLNVVGSTRGVYRFWVAKPAGRLPNRPFAPSRRVRGDVLGFHSRPDLHPVAVRVTRQSSRTAAGDIFVAPEYGPLQTGPMVLDPSGGLVWFKPLPKYTLATDVRVQTYAGQPVLTWWQGYFGAGVGSGEGVINDTAYRQVAVVRAGNGLTADLHEFKLTPRGTALIDSVFPVYWDASSIHKSRNAIVFDCVVQEIDVKTGLVEFQWDSLDHIPLSASYTKFPPRAGAPFDYFHLNSVDEDQDGNLVISARSTSAAYKIDRSSGRVIWTLGGKNSSFKLGSGASMAFQHDVRVQAGGDSRITAFDNGAGLYNVHSQSRGLILGVDVAHHTVRKLGEFDHSPRLLAAFEGNVQPLANGDSFIGWGQQPYFTEYNFRGQMLFDAHFADINASYRAYRFPWTGVPGTAPAVAAANSGGKTNVYASWNGATGVASWRVLAGGSATTLAPVSTAGRTGFETTASINAAPYVAVQALDGAGHVLGQSATVKSH